MNRPPHTSAAYQAELQELRDRLLAMGGRCEKLIGVAVNALVDQNSELAASAADADRQINSDEMAVDDLAVRILALRQPVGRDLRGILATLKVVTDLERIGDEAVNIAERASELSRVMVLPGPSLALPQMERISSAMLHEALDSFVEEDVDNARKVLARDDEVDALYGQIVRDCVAFMRSNPEQIESCMKVASCAKYLERVADHATNIAEMVVYLVQGEDVRHSGKREPKA